MKWKQIAQWKPVVYWLSFNLSTVYQIVIVIIMVVALCFRGREFESRCGQDFLIFFSVLAPCRTAGRVSYSKWNQPWHSYT